MLPYQVLTVDYGLLTVGYWLLTVDYWRWARNCRWRHRKGKQPRPFDILFQCRRARLRCLRSVVEGFFVIIPWILLTGSNNGWPLFTPTACGPIVSFFRFHRNLGNVYVYMHRERECMTEPTCSYVPVDSCSHLGWIEGGLQKIWNRNRATGPSCQWT